MKHCFEVTISGGAPVEAPGSAARGPGLQEVR